MSAKGGKYWVLIAAVAALQTGFLAKMAYDRVSLIAHGREITLKVIPVDPRDVFRGEYVILGYDISQVPMTAAGAEVKELSRGEAIYATLKAGANGAWTVTALAAEYPSAVDPGDVVLKGLVRHRFLPPADPAASPAGARGETMSIRYGIESYFVPEGAGRALEQSVRDQEIQAIVAVGTDGTAALKGLIIGGERHEDPPML